jgi:hypothetical protein
MSFLNMSFVVWERESCNVDRTYYVTPGSASKTYTYELTQMSMLWNLICTTILLFFEEIENGYWMRTYMCML